MDIKIPSDLPATKPVAAQVGDLLAQLKTAGTIEAEVLKLLPGNKLLLSSRLGDILTSNSLNYRAGDRLTLRFDDSARQPVLKVSPRPSKPLLLDSRQNPELTRALTSDRPMLASVIRIVAQQAEIRLADQTLKLPRAVALVKNQLLSLQRNDVRHSIEITRLEPKAFYKAILKQLVPQQAETRTSSLVRLLNLIAPNAVEPRPALPRRLETGRSQWPAKPIPAPAARGQTVTRVNAGNSFEQALAIRASGGPQTAVTSASGAPGKTSESSSTPGPGSAARPLSAISSGNPLPGALQPAPANNRSAPLTHPGNPATGSSQAHKGGATRSVALQQPANPVRPSVPVMQAGGAAPNTRGSDIETTASQTRSGRAIPGNESYRHAAAAVQGAQAAAGQATPPGPAQATGLSGQPVGGNASLAPALQPLLQLVTRFPDIDAAQIKKWLEFARLIYPSKATVSTAPSPDIFRLLKQFSEGESLSRDLTQALQQNSRVSADADSPTTRAQAQEALLMQAREGFKLIEQSLTQNLLQRATLGLQQETQQPLSFGFALPYADAQHTKSLYIDLAERNQAQDEADKSWDIRLSFELAGLGPITCHLVLAGCTVGASFYSEQAQTRESIEMELPQLRQQLSRAGFTPGEFHSFPGKPAPKQAPTAADFSEALVDIEV